VVGLYLNPPERALVLSCDEKSQIQALNRTQPGLPMKKGRAGTVTHDYKRHGTTTLFAALNTLDGTVISMCQQQHRHAEWLQFLRLIQRKTPKHLQLHLIVDNYGTHTHPEVQAWLAKHPRFVMHFTPTSASWLNMSSASSATSRRTASGATASPACLNWNWRSISMSNTTTPTPNPSSGPRARLTSWPRSREPRQHLHGPKDKYISEWRTTLVGQHAR
jgi:transposase